MNRAYGEIFEKICLLCSERNLILKEALAQLRSQADRVDGRKKDSVKSALTLAYGVSPTALNDWRRDEKPTVEMLSKLTGSVEALFARANPAPAAGVHLTADDFSPAVSKYAFGTKLGLHWRDVQTIVDTKLFAENSHPRVFTLPSEDASDLARRFEGVYFAHHFTPSYSDPTKPVLARSALRVRHVIDVRRELAVVVCKLHIPAAPQLASDAGRYYPYLGLMKGGRRHRNVYWSFDEYSKDDSRRDLDMVSIFATPTVAGQLVGTLTSVGTGGEIYSSGVALERLPGQERQPEDRDFYKKHMRQDIRLIEAAEEIHAFFRAHRDIADALVGRFFLSGVRTSPRIKK